jgi:4-amino-4-deoxy-L-arabinose transferase-like glycosyltransferase
MHVVANPVDVVSNDSLVSQKHKSFEFWKSKRYHIWVTGFLLRLIVTPFEFSNFDYNTFRLPIARGLANGEGLYKDVDSNQMPIYPYLNALVVWIFGPEDDALTAVLIKLPAVIGDTILAVLIFVIGSKLINEKTGLISSFIYALNPIAIYEISNARWDVFASLFVLLSLHFLLLNKPYHVGIMISLGFLIKEFPIFFFGTVIAFWFDDWKKIMQSGIAFLMSTSLILAAVLLPFGTSIFEMWSDLSGHPIYAEGATTCVEACHAPMQDIIDIIRYFTDFPTNWLIILWAILFTIMALFPMYLYIKNPSEDKILNLILVHITLLSIFFWSIHSQFVLWLLPWALLWSFKKGGRVRWSPLVLALGFLLRKISYGNISQTIFDYPGDFLLICCGVYYIYSVLRFDLRNDT